MKKQLYFLIAFLIFNFSFAYSQNSDTLFYKLKKAKTHQNEILLVLLQGYGSNEDDLMGLSGFFPDNFTIVCPRATYTLRQGAYQWYTSQKSNGGFDGNPKEVQESRTKIYETVTRLQEKFDIEPRQTIVAGFSQGANMSYQMALHSPQLMAGIGAFSGTLFESLKINFDTSKLNQPAIFIAHGDQDNRIPYTAAQNSYEWLTNHGAQPIFKTYNGMKHAISREEMQDFYTFVRSTTKH
ncbi:MAG: hypothetical protein CL843_06935 [Crocinitomicaceae bacterium]|nr:hypothetical protein [Crocinitomicaceae bacterium]